MGGPGNTDKIMAGLGFQFNTLITQANFPIRPSEPRSEDEIEIFDPRCLFNEEKGFVLLKEAKLFRPNYEHGIRFAEQCGKMEMTLPERKSFVIFLHEPWKDPYGRPRVICFYRNAEARGLNLYFSGLETLGSSCILAGIRPHSPR